MKSSMKAQSVCGQKRDAVFAPPPSLPLRSQSLGRCIAGQYIGSYTLYRVVQ